MGIIDFSSLGFFYVHLLSFYISVFLRISKTSSEFMKTDLAQSRGTMFWLTVDKRCRKLIPSQAVLTKNCCFACVLCRRHTNTFSARARLLHGSVQSLRAKSGAPYSGYFSIVPLSPRTTHFFFFPPLHTQSYWASFLPCFVRSFFQICYLRWEGSNNSSLSRNLFLCRQENWMCKWGTHG